MDEQTNPMMPVPEVQTPNPTPPPPAAPPAKPASSMRVVWMVLIGVAVLAGAAYGWMKLYPASPVALESASPSPTATADATAGWKTYTNAQYGFVFKYPETTELTDSQFTYQIWDVSAMKIVGGNLRIDSVNPPFSLSVLENSLDPQNIYGTYGKIESPDLVQVGNQVGYKYREGDAGTNTIEIQTKLGAKKILLISFLDVETSEYQGPTIDPEVFVALRELQNQILSTFKFTDATAGWTPFSSKYFTLSFRVPANFKIEESQNVIQIAGPQPTPGPYESTYNFLELSRYTGPTTKTIEMEKARATLKNIIQDTILVDGSSVVRITGNPFRTVNGKDEIFPNKIEYVFFDRSVVVILGGNSNLVGDDPDPIALGNQILSTFRFTK